MNTERLISLDTSKDRDNIGFVINEKEEKKKKMGLLLRNESKYGGGVSRYLMLGRTGN